jgi:hypothetical protein
MMSWAEAARALPTIVPSPLAGEGSFAGRHKCARVRGLHPVANIFPYEFAGAHPSSVAGFARATFSRKGRRKERASTDITGVKSS